MPRKSGSYQISAALVTVFAHLLVVAVTTLVLVWLLHFQGGLAFKSADKGKILNVHILLMAVGFILFAGEGAMAYKSVPTKKKVQRAVHGTLHFIALLAGAVGVYAAFKFDHEVGNQDMSSLHSWIGMITICLFGLQWLFGFFCFVFPGAEMSSRASYKPWHVFGGLAILFVAICTALTGLVETSSTLGLGRSQEGLIVNFTGLLLVLFTLSVALSGVLPRRY